jgi:LAO/AO transport system kinase
VSSAHISLESIARGGKRALAQALAALEAEAQAPQTVALLDRAYAAPRARVIGLTGPPGVGKSTLVNALIAHWRAAGLSVGVIAVDPSSPVSGGALLGDRTRLATDPDDDGVFVRSMAARGRLGGLAQLTIASAVLMRALFDRLVIETVGVGQSESDIVHVADTTVFCVQPASGDSLQFMKAGIMEMPDIVAVNKSDMGAAAERAAADVRAALTLGQGAAPHWAVPVVRLSAAKGEGIEELVDKLDAHFTMLDDRAVLAARRLGQAQHWVRDAVRDRFGTFGLERAGFAVRLADGDEPFSMLGRLEALLGRTGGDGS